MATCQFSFIVVFGSAYAHAQCCFSTFAELGCSVVKCLLKYSLMNSEIFTAILAKSGFALNP